MTRWRKGSKGRRSKGKEGEKGEGRQGGGESGEEKGERGERRRRRRRGRRRRLRRPGLEGALASQMYPSERGAALPGVARGSGEGGREGRRDPACWQGLLAGRVTAGSCLSERGGKAWPGTKPCSPAGPGGCVSSPKLPALLLGSGLGLWRGTVSGYNYSGVAVKR